MPRTTRKALYTPPGTSGGDFLRVVIVRNHQHRGVEYGPGDTLPVTPHQAEMLLRFGAIEAIPTPVPVRRRGRKTKPSADGS